MSEVIPINRKKRGMALAIEIVEWMFKQTDSLAGDLPLNSVAREVLQTRSSHFREVAKVLRQEAGL